MHTDPTDETLSDRADQASAVVPEQPTPTRKPLLWGRTTQGLGTVASTVTAAGSTVASGVGVAGSSAVSTAVAVGTAGANLASKATKSVVSAGGQVIAKTGIGTAVEYLDHELEQRGVKQALGSAAGAVVDRLDQVTGKQLVELLEARLRMQDEYNDVLATRLAEALERIAALEEKVSHGLATRERASGNPCRHGRLATL